MNDSRLLQVPSLEYLIKALILKSDKTSSDILSAMFSLDVLIDITIANKDRIDIFW